MKANRLPQNAGGADIGSNVGLIGLRAKPVVKGGSPVVAGSSAAGSIAGEPEKIFLLDPVQTAERGTAHEAPGMLWCLLFDCQRERLSCIVTEVVSKLL
jgi:hypothetical protein